MQVTYTATDQLPHGVPAAVVGAAGRVVVVLSRTATIDELCEALGPLLTAHAAECWKPGALLAG